MYMRQFVLTGVLVLGLLAVPGVSSAMSETGERYGNGAAHSAAIKGFTEEERVIIRTVLDEVLDRTIGEDHDGRHTHKKGRHGKKSLPPGLAKRDSLPPGLQKQIAETGHLPPGLEGRDFPDDLYRRLPRRNDGSKKVWIGDDVYLIEKATRKVIDILVGAGKGK